MSPDLVNFGECFGVNRTDDLVVIENAEYCSFVGAGDLALEAVAAALDGQI